MKMPLGSELYYFPEDHSNSAKSLVKTTRQAEKSLVICGSNASVPRILESCGANMSDLFEAHKGLSIIDG